MMCSLVSALGDEIPSSIDTINLHVLSAIEVGDFDQFVAYGHDELRGRFSKLAFRGLYLSLGVRLASGYHLTYWGVLNRHNQVTAYVWRLTFQDGGEDSLWELAIKDAKVFAILAQ